MSVITANDIKRRGVASITESLKNSKEATITVRGENKYVVMSVDQYQHLRTCELEAALQEVREDREKGRIIHKNVSEHIAHLKDG